jgi:hypothetical protein
MIKKTKTKRQKSNSTTSLPSKIIKSEIHWEEAYPCFKDIYKIGTDPIPFEVVRFLSPQEIGEKEFENFLFTVIRSDNLPSFMKNDFKKIRKAIEKEILAREKTLESLTKEQVDAYKFFFKEPNYFLYDVNNEYFDHEIERVCMLYLKNYCSTGLYDSRVRISNKKSAEALNKRLEAQDNG